MASVSGGDVVEVSFSNANVGSGFFYVVAGEDSTFVPGGYENDDNSAINGAKQLLITKTLKPGTCEFVASNDMNNDPPDVDTAKALQNDLTDTVWTIAHSNGNTYKGSGVIVGSLSASGKDSKFTIKLASGSGFTKQ